MSALPRGLIVSCQARADNPLHGPTYMVAMARAAEQAGAVALRVNGAADIAAVREAVSLPVIGISKLLEPGREVYITPTYGAARAVVAAGAGIVGLDCTARVRPDVPWREILAMLKDEGVEVFADVSTVSEGMAAAMAGADYVATTLSGYTSETSGGDEAPDLALVEALAKKVAVPVVAEGRYKTPEDVARAFDAGAHAVVVGTAITNPREITRRFVAAVSGTE